MLRFFATALSVLMLAGSAQAQVKATVESGVLAGTSGETAEVFRNIPFAAPPVGKLRWAPPAPPVAWTGERDATANGPSCMQPMSPDGSPNAGGANGPMSEDCLQLNVFAPKAARKAPVMVWLHGGGHRTGAGWVYDGSNFARDGVVLVSINYRLGPLGYFAHPALTREAGAEPTGNYGLMDQIAALEWVQRNIAAFGGDPKNVTVFGESAGGMSTLALLSTPKAKPLFKRAIVQSGGGWFRVSTLADEEAKGAKAAESLRLAGAEASANDLRKLPAATLIAKLGGDYGPFVDGKLMTETPSQAFAAGRAADLPLIIGANSGEDSLLGPWKPEMAATISAAARSVYAEEAAASDETLGRAVFTDRLMVGPARWVAAKASGGKPAWLYHFSYVGSRFRPMMTRAFHAAEIQYVFEYWGRRTPMSAVSDEDRAMATLMHACWVAFAKAGVPKCGTQPWPAYSPRSDQLMEFGAGNGVRAGFRKSRLDAQETVALPTLALPAN
ncbi:carboxylesterase family protein [Phenylobacterium sp. LH3H17]|uniref:carboxylesterase/lipase family protein n=1 Tax=Phenylobacterium sp. LH3H17 TaxID=2903901 RepID=UPI0020C9ED17|nr:carboxylesterase family protein [Phenylobacterium sp. LH3H17]UTP40052.1 carboxylesterase family protein [Phenylobacterium sp. LH3H17]